jgi:hypothetical protein
MKIQHNLGLTNPTKLIVLKDCNVSLVKDNYNLYSIDNLLHFLTKEFIGVDKNDIDLINTLKLYKVTHITI